MVTELNYVTYLVKNLLLKHHAKKPKNILNKHGLISNKLTKIDFKFF